LENNKIQTLALVVIEGDKGNEENRIPLRVTSLANGGRSKGKEVEHLLRGGLCPI